MRIIKRPPPKLKYKFEKWPKPEKKVKLIKKVDIEKKENEKK